MAEYGSMFLVSGLASILFLGGWHGPLPVFDAIGMSTAGGLAGYLANLAGCLNFLFKAFALVTVMMWVRWTLPRLRIDQVMTTCLKYCVPLASICFLGALAWTVMDVPFLNHVAPAAARGTVRESWVLDAERESDVQAAAWQAEAGVKR